MKLRLLAMTFFLGACVAASVNTPEEAEPRVVSEELRAQLEEKVTAAFSLACQVRTPVNREDGGHTSVLSVTFKTTNEPRLRAAARPAFAREVVAIIAPLIPPGTDVRSICVQEAPQEFGAFLDKLGKAQPECVSLDEVASDAGT